MEGSVMMTPVRHVSEMPEEVKSAFALEPEIKTALELGEYICKHKSTFPQDLLKLSEEKTNVSELILKHLRLNLDAIKHLSVVLYFIRHIKFADFTDMQLNSESLEVLAAALYRLTDLIELHLTCNDLHSGCQHLNKSLSGLTALQHLNLNDTNLHSTDFISLCPSLKSLKYLETLQVSLNPIGDEGCQAFCEILLVMPALFSVEMFTCEISNKGGELLMKVLPSCSLGSFLLGNNKFTPRFENKLKDKFGFVHVGVRHSTCGIL